MPTSAALRLLRRAKESERKLGRWLLFHDGPDPRPEYTPGAGLVTTTGRVGHINELQFDIFSKTYAAENKNVLLNKQWTLWWTKVIKRAQEHGKVPLLAIDPSNVDPRLPDMHIITAARHADLLEAERELALLKAALNDRSTDVEAPWCSCRGGD